ncbi:unnamed protein product [Symbiodinium sp. CCMP2592]|nr:unnamed protein product [Symbiodinium sp. CCMP2592]
MSGQGSNSKQAEFCLQDRKHVVYQDLIALLTLASQVQQDRLTAHEARARERAQKLKEQASLLTKLTRAVSKLAARINLWEDMMRPWVGAKPSR